MVALAKMPKGIRHDTSIDWIGAAAFTAALTTLTVGLFRISEPDLPMILLFVAAAVLTGIVAISNRTASEKAVPRSLGKLWDFIWSNVTHFLGGRRVDDRIGQCATASWGRFTGCRRWDSGLLLVRMTVALGVSAFAGGFIATRFGVRLPTIVWIDTGSYRVQFHVDLGYRAARTASFDRSGHCKESDWDCSLRR